MKKILQKVTTVFRNRGTGITLIIFVGIFCVMMTNAVHESYPDEFDNILGGWMILHGRLLYTGFFTHHNPVAYWIASFVEIFSGQSFVRFRLLYTLFLFGYFVWTYRFLHRRVSNQLSRVYLSFLIVLSFTSVYFWGQMLLADNISAYLLVPVFALLLFKTIQQKPIQHDDLLFVSLLIFLSVFSSLTYIYLALGLYLYTAYLYLKGGTLSLRKRIAPLLGIFSLPFLVLLMYLLLTGSIVDYLKDAIVFNGKYYVYNYPGHTEGQGIINPVRYMVVIFYTFFQNFTTLLIQVASFNFSFPFNITLALANVVLWIYLLIRRKWIFALLAFFYMMYANVRSDPLTSKETDYQSAVYIVTSLFVIVFVLYEIYTYTKERAEGIQIQRVVLTGLFLLLSTYSFFTATYLLRSYNDKVYNKFMGLQPLIYDRPTIAPIMNEITRSGEYMWIGPFAFEDLFYTNGLLPSKYGILLPGFRTATDIQQEMVSDFKNHPPIVMYFDKRFFILGRSPEMYAQFFIDFVNMNYVTLETLKAQGEQYTLIAPDASSVGLDTKLYIRKDAKREILNRMINRGIISQI